MKRFVLKKNFFMQLLQRVNEYLRMDKHVKVAVNILGSYFYLQYFLFVRSFAKIRLLF